MDAHYYNAADPGAFGGVLRLQRAANVSRKEAQNFLLRSDTYTLHKALRRKFVRRKTIAYYKNELFQADLADFQQLSRFNKGYRYVLVCIDVFSKFVFYLPVKSKKADEMQHAFKTIFKVAKPKLLQTDRGTEFTSRTMQAFFKQHGIVWYHTFSESKATIAERQIRTLKEALTRLFHHTGKKTYYTHLPKLATAYNNTPHTRTGVAPAHVNADNEQKIFARLYGEKRRRRTPIKPKFDVGESVRIAIQKGIFSKGHARRWSNEIFTIGRIKLSDPIMYYLNDINGEEIVGGFYAEELNRVIKDNTSYWDVEKILRRRKRDDGTTEYLVKWVGYGKEHNSWVSDIQRK